MARGEEREFELVLGNKQLLSMFFLVVVLLAVFLAAVDVGLSWIVDRVLRWG